VPAPPRQSRPRQTPGRGGGGDRGCVWVDVVDEVAGAGFQRKHACVHVCASAARARTHARTCLHKHTHTRTRARTCANTHACVCKLACTRVRAQTHMHTHVHTHTIKRTDSDSQTRGATIVCQPNAIGASNGRPGGTGRHVWLLHT
jgi:hypothetical protein